MSYYPATVIVADESKIVVRFEESGHKIAFPHDAYNAVSTHLRQVGVKGFVSFPKAPPVFTEKAA